MKWMKLAQRFLYSSTAPQPQTLYLFISFMRIHQTFMSSASRTVISSIVIYHSSRRVTTDLHIITSKLIWSMEWQTRLHSHSYVWCVVIIRSSLRGGCDCNDNDMSALMTTLIVVIVSTKWWIDLIALSDNHTGQKALCTVQTTMED